MLFPLSTMELMSQTSGIHCSGEGIKITNKKLVNFREFKPKKAENSRRIQAKNSKKLVNFENTVFP